MRDNEVHDHGASAAKRWMTFAAWIVISSTFFITPLMALLRLSLSSDDASYLLLIPFLGGWVLFVERQSIVQEFSGGAGLGGAILLLGVCVGIGTRLLVPAGYPDLRLSGQILALILLWIGGFALFFGKTAAKAGYFPLLFLFLTVPLPPSISGRLIYLLQVGSAAITGALFDLLRVPALREGFVFHLAHVNIEVAEECSGIRSSMVLFILALLVVHFNLRSFWKKVFFLACGLFMMILKNGIRIATLTLLAIYIDPGFLTGRLHREGGVIFFLLGLLLLLPVLLLLQHGEPNAFAGKKEAIASSQQGS
jgi:exosortase